MFQGLQGLYKALLFPGLLVGVEFGVLGLPVSRVQEVLRCRANIEAGVTTNNIP